MNVVTMPKQIVGGEPLVLIPLKEYEEFLRGKKANGKNVPQKDIVVKHTMKVPKRHEKFYDELDKELTEDLKDYQAGKFYGPFNSAYEGIKFLENRRDKKLLNEA